MMRTLGIAMFGLSVLGVGCGSQPEVVEEKLRPVRSAVVSNAGSQRLRSFSGTTRAGTVSRLSFRVPGTITELSVQVGDTVSRGQLIAALDPLDAQLKVEEAQASLAQAQATRRNAEAERDRVRELYENDSASLRQWDQARASAESAIAQVESISKRLELLRRQLGYTRLIAPVDGGVAEVVVEVNENVQAGQGVVTLTSGERTKVEVAIPSTLIAGVQEGDPVDVSFDALPGRSFPATVTEVGVAASGSTTFPVTAVLETLAPTVLPGMAADVDFTFASSTSGEPNDRLIVPTVAVGEDRVGRFVFIVEPKGDGTAIIRRQAVTVGELTPEGIVIVEGIEAGAVIVTAGVRRLGDGHRVRFSADSGPTS